VAGELTGRTLSLGDEICAELDRPLSPEVRDSISFFVDHLSASLALGAPDALTGQLHWQTRRLRVLTPGLDAEQLAAVTRSVVERRLDDDAARSATAHLERALDALAGQPPPDERPDPSFGDLARDYLDLALARHHDEAVDLVLASGLAPHDVMLKILEPAQSELGRRWEHDHVSVAQEHDTTALTQRVMAMLRGRRKGVVEHGHTVYAGIVGDELHSVGLDMVADLLGSAGWGVHRAPGAVQHTGVVDQLVRVRPDVLALSVTLFKHVVELRAVVEAVKGDERTRHIPVVVGGRPFRENPALVDLVGADDWAVDGQGAIEACQRSTGLTPERHVNDVTREMVHPLETMIGLAALLQDDESLSHRQRDLAGRIIKAGGQLMTVVEDVGHGLVVVHGGPDERSSWGLVDLDELVESLLVRHQGRAAQRDIVMRQIRIPPDRGRVVVEGDVSQLERVVDTLLDNAVAVTPSSGVITVRVKRNGDTVAIAVADEGPTIPAGGRDAIFDASRATSSSGATDLGPWRGLAVVRRIAEQHHGMLSGTSDHRGAVFTLELPLSARMLAHEPETGPADFPPLAVVPRPGSPTAG
jgi:signal transduction histidine kinase